MGLDQKLAGVLDRSLERRRLPRLNLSSEQFKLSEDGTSGASGGKIFPIQDLSLTGMRLWVAVPKDLFAFSVGQIRSGHLNLKREKYPVTIRIKRVTADQVGCEFVGLAPPTADALKSFLSPVALAAALRPLPTADVHNTVWYHGPSCTELLMKRALDGHYHLLDVYVLGQYVHWDEEAGLVTGTSQSSDQRSEIQGILRIETLLLNRDLVPDPQKLGIAKTFILSSNLPLDLKTWCVRQLD